MQEQERYRVAHLSELRPLAERDPGEGEWKPVRHHFGIRSFGANAWVADAEGETVVPEHTETLEQAGGHEELYVVTSGRATFTLDGEELDAPAGTLVYVGDPGVRRKAVAREPGTAVLAIGGKPGEAFQLSRWEQKYI